MTHASLTHPPSQLSRRALLGGAVMVAGAGVVGCSDTATTGSGGGTLVIGSPTDIDPKTLIRFRAPNQPLRRTVFDYLLDLTDDGGYEPGLATGWEWNADFTEVKITLRDGVTYHDGRAFTAEDLVGNLEIATAPESGSQAGKMMSRAKSFAATGELEVTCTMGSPFPSFLDAFAALPIIDPQTWDDVASGTTMNGTGPFIWKNWTTGTSVDLDANQDYWDGAPAIDAVQIKVITEPQAQLAAMRSGDIDVALRMLARDAATFTDDQDYSVGMSRGYEIYVGCNTAVKPFDDPRVRQAVAYSIDRERIASQVYSGFGDPSCVSWALGTPGINEEQASRYEYDIDKARALLAEAGAVGVKTGITHDSSEPTYGANQDIVQYGLQEAGFDVEVVPYDPTQFTEHLQTATLPGVWTTDVALTALGVVPSLLTANPLLPGTNTHNYDDQDYAQLIESLIAADDENRAAAVSTLMDHMQDSAHHNTIVQAKTPLVSKAKVSGMELDHTLAIRLAKARIA